MGKKLYIGNLSYDVSSSDLEALLSPHGTISLTSCRGSAQTARQRDDLDAIALHSRPGPQSGLTRAEFGSMLRAVGSSNEVRT